MIDSFASRLATALAMLTAPCPGCRALLRADPSLRIPLTCRCGLRLMPRREIGGISLVSLKGTAS